MTIHLWHTTKLAHDLAGKRVSERDAMQYMMAGSILYTYTIYWSLWFGTYRDLTFFLELAVVVIIGLVGVFECYKANGKAEGEDFLIRYSALAVPIGIKLAVFGLLIGQVLYFGADHILGRGAFRDSEMVYRYILFVIPVAFAFIYYWRIAHHIGIVRALQAGGTRVGEISHHALEISTKQGYKFILAVVASTLITFIGTSYIAKKYTYESVVNMAIEMDSYNDVHRVESYDFVEDMIKKGCNKEALEFINYQRASLLAGLRNQMRDSETIEKRIIERSREVADRAFKENSLKGSYTYPNCK